MTSGIAANYSLPTMANTLSNNAVANATSTGSTGGTSSTSMDSSNIGSTFLTLLTQELQNQDPTAPMDSTAMVGQMISLNSLSQLISINQTLSNATGASASNAVQQNAVQQAATNQPSVANTVKDAAVSAIQAAASSANPLSYLFPMNQIAGSTAANAANVSAAQSALLTAPSAITH